jgi:nicotinate dehydrogenase subunit A
MATLNVNGETHEVDVDPQTPLLYVLRNDLNLNGAKFGCGLGQCGACTVLLDGRAIFSCVTPVSVIGDRQVTTVEGLGTAESPSPLQQAFIDEQAAQCGFCIAGFIMRAQAILDRTPNAAEAEIRKGLKPNLCRCGTHMRILRAVLRAADGTQAATADQGGYGHERPDRTRVVGNSDVAPFASPTDPRRRRAGCEFFARPVLASGSGNRWRSRGGRNTR